MRNFLLTLPLLLAGCAATGPDETPVSITTASDGRQFDGSSCVVATHSATWNIITPATLVIGRGDGDLRIVCDKSGYRTSELILPPYGRSSGSGVGLGVGGGSGNVGLGLGLSFPLTNSGGYYPAQIVVDMRPL